MQRWFRHTTAAGEHRRGAFIVLGFFALVVCLGFVAFSVDIGMISLTRTQMQNSVDAAALAAAMEITNAVQTAPLGTENITAFARQAARDKAVDVAALNGVHINGNQDVIFGQRSFNANTGRFTTDWGISGTAPSNCVKVIARRENSDTSAPDGQLKLSFAGIFGDNTARLHVEATAYVEARDIVVVHDFSQSMNYDSFFSASAMATLSPAQIVSNSRDTWDDLQPLNLGTMTFDPQYLTLSRANPNISVTFRYNMLDASTSNDMKSVRLRFTTGQEQTINVAGNAQNKKNLTFQGTSANASRDIDRAWVTVSVPRQRTVSGGTVNQSGTPSITATFASNKRSVSVQSSHNLQNVELRFSNNGTQSFSLSGKGGTYSGTGGNANRNIAAVRVRYSNSWKAWISIPADTTQTVYEDETYEFVDSVANVRIAFGLNNVSYPYPSGSWDEFINFCRSNAGLRDNGYREMYGGLSFVNYIFANRSSHSQTPALATARHYPFHAIKSGHNLLCDFLKDLGFDDHIGMVSYDTTHRIESRLNVVGLPLVDISQKPLCTSYDDVANLMRYKQANHYSQMTNTAGGMISAISLLDNHKRSGARQNILLMTDGNANQTEGSTTLPGNYQSWFNGYDGPGSTYNVSFDGAANGTVNARRALLNQVNNAVGKDYVIHTIAVGADADWRTMKAIAHYAGGEFLRVDGGTSPEEMEAALLAAFLKIAGLVPPAKLLGPGEE